MNYRNNGSYNNLEAFRVRYDGDRFKSLFHEMAANRRQQAVTMINDQGLLFRTFYMLLPEVEDQKIFKELSTRNITALKICAQVQRKQDLLSQVKDITEPGEEATHNVLRWMLRTGSADDGAENDFDGVLDGTAALLAENYQDKTILPIVADMIFKRNQKDLYLHDLTWAFFRSRDPHTLRLIAGYLRSSRQKDYELACRLLNLTPLPQLGAGQQKQYNDYLAWLNENYNYLCFTEESFQFSSDPKPFDINIDAKYLCKTISPQNNAMVQPLSDTERDLLRNYNKLSEEEQLLLSQHSQRLHEKNPRMWESWLKSSINEQVTTARAAMGGVV